MDRAIVLYEDHRLGGLAGPGTKKPIELLEMGDEIAAAFGRTGVDDELARDVIERPQHGDLLGLSRRRHTQVRPRLCPCAGVPVPPAPLALSLAGVGALAVNLSCALMLARYRTHGGSLTRAAFLSSRNDALANIAIIAAGLVTAFLWPSAWPDLIVGLGIAAMNADAARDVWTAAHEEHATAVD